MCNICRSPRVLVYGNAETRPDERAGNNRTDGGDCPCQGGRRRGLLKAKLVQYDATRSFSAWLYKVSANHCWDMLRRRKIRQDKETDDLENVPLEHPDPGQLERLIEQRTSAEVRKALDKLGGRARMALVMRYYSDMSYDEIADALGVRRAFVGVVLLRARHELRQALEGNAALAAGGTS